jgi:hypothetical protein
MNQIKTILSCWSYEHSNIIVDNVILVMLEIIVKVVLLNILCYKSPIFPICNHALDLTTIRLKKWKLLLIIIFKWTRNTRII